jgi:uncharacterized RDD family membrane protein YckC
VAGAAAPQDAPLAAPTAPASEAAAEHDWRGELSTRVERFRQRRRAQATLPLQFEESEALDFPPPAPPRPPAKIIPFARKNSVGRRQEAESRREADGPPPASCLPPTASHGELKVAATPARHTPPVDPYFAQSSLAFPEPPVPPIESTVDFPVAPLAARVMSGVFDAAWLALGYAAFFGVYTALGGKFHLQKGAALALAAALILLGAAYLFLFLYYAAATPGMRWLGLRVVDFDGQAARRGQRLLRAMAVGPSAAALGFGFLWAAFDDEALTWHDRVSRTCLTMSGSPLLKQRNK